MVTRPSVNSIPVMNATQMRMWMVSACLNALRHAFGANALTVRHGL